MPSIRNLALSLCESCEPVGLSSRLSHAWEHKGEAPVIQQPSISPAGPAPTSTLG